MSPLEISTLTNPSELKLAQDPDLNILGFRRQVDLLKSLSSLGSMVGSLEPESLYLVHVDRSSYFGLVPKPVIREIILAQFEASLIRFKSELALWLQLGGVSAKLPEMITQEFPVFASLVIKCSAALAQELKALPCVASVYEYE